MNIFGNIFRLIRLFLQAIMKIRTRKYYIWANFGNVAIIFFITASIIVTLHSSSIAQDDKFSFRLRGMGVGLHGIIDDLYSDLSLNPAFIHRYKGNWLYTNFSNLQGGEDISQLNQDLNLLRNFDLYPNNLIGAITDRFGAPFGIFLETRGYNLLTDNLSSNEQFLTATTGIINGSRELFDTENASQSISFIGLVRDIGIKISIHRNDFNLKLSSENTFSRFAVNDTSGNRDNVEFVKNITTRDFDFPNSMIGISVGKIFKSENQEISLSAGTRPERTAFQSNEILSFFKEPLLNGIADKFDILNNRETGFFEMGLSSVFINARVKKIYPSINDLQQNTFSLNFTRYTVPFDIKTSENTVHDSLDIAGASRKNVTFTRDGFSDAVGEGILNRVELAVGVERHFGNLNTLIAIGAKIDYIWGKTDITFGPGKIAEKLTIDVDVGDPAEEAESFNRIISDNKQSTVTSDLRGTFLSIPVGFEAKITDRFTIRLGARTIIPLTFKTESESTVSDMPDELLQTDEALTTFVSQDGPGTVTTTSTLFDGKKLNYNSYHFGASFKANDMITLDLLHFSKVTELDTWWFSIVLRY